MFAYVFPAGWEPSLARLDQSGYINAWMGVNKMSWIQVRYTDFLCTAFTLILVMFTCKTETEHSEM